MRHGLVGEDRETGWITDGGALGTKPWLDPEDG
jgi:hypothetical protein